MVDIFVEWLARLGFEESSIQVSAWRIADQIEKFCSFL
jgi:hypothetical protein